MLFHTFKKLLTCQIRDFAKVETPKMDAHITALKETLQTTLNNTQDTLESIQAKVALVEERIKYLEPVWLPYYPGFLKTWLPYIVSCGIDACVTICDVPTYHTWLIRVRCPWHGSKWAILYYSSTTTTPATVATNHECGLGYNTTPDLSRARMPSPTPSHHTVTINKQWSATSMTKGRVGCHK